MGEELLLAERIVGGGCGGGAMEQGLGLRIGVVCCECGWVVVVGLMETWMAASMAPSGDWSISSMGDSSVGVAMVDWEKRLELDESGISGTNELPELMVGKVRRRGRDGAEARGGRRVCCDGIRGDGPQDESGEKKGDVGERISGEKQEVMACSEKEVTLSEWEVR